MTGSYASVNGLEMYYETHGSGRPRLAVLPRTTHITLVHRAGWLLSMVMEVLDDPGWLSAGGGTVPE